MPTREFTQTAPRGVANATFAAARRTRSTGAPVEVPISIRAIGTAVDADDRAYLRRKLERRLGKFASGIQRVSVRFEDSNGPRGGVDKVCRIKVTLRGLPSAIIESRGASARAAMDAALARLGSAVKRPLQRRRDKPLASQRRARQAERLE